MGKYGNRKVEYDGHKFDSVAEQRRYQELKLLLAAGQIVDLELQPKYILVPKQKGERELAYIGDFRYREPIPFTDSEAYVVVVEDVKGFKTKDYIAKRKMFKWLYPDIDFREVVP